MRTYNVKSPAKINIGLRVLSKRMDGYHNIETIFYPIELHDRIRAMISTARETQINVKVRSSLSNTHTLNNENNICYKAVELFIRKFKIKKNHRFIITINKNIPTGAGLGGGSSNAASVLKVLARHFKIPVSGNPGLLKLALELGSDVPFFLYGKPAYASGRGEKIIPLPKFKVYYNIKINNPGIHVSTAWAYKQLEKQNAKGQSAERAVKKLNKVSSFSINNAYEFVNDFEKVVFRKYPEIEKLKQEMYIKGAVFASMSGSGSSVYGFFKAKRKQPINAGKKQNLV